MCLKTNVSFIVGFFSKLTVGMVSICQHHTVLLSKIIGCIHRVQCDSMAYVHTLVKNHLKGNWKHAKIVKDRKEMNREIKTLKLK